MLHVENVLNQLKSTSENFKRCSKENALENWKLFSFSGKLYIDNFAKPRKMFSAFHQHRCAYSRSERKFCRKHIL